MGQKKFGFQTEKKCLKSEHLCLDFGHFFCWNSRFQYFGLSAKLAIVFFNLLLLALPGA